MTSYRVRRSKSSPYTRIDVGHDGLHVSLHENFWDDTIIDEEGTTQLDANVVALLSDISVALYFVASSKLLQH